MHCLLISDSGHRFMRLLYGFVLTLVLLMTVSVSAFAATGVKQLPGNIDSPRDEIQVHSSNLRQLMLELYRLNPDELRKSTQVSAEEYIQWVFEGPFGWKFDAIRGLQGVDALELVYSAEYQGDRVLPLIAGLHTMLVRAYGGETEYRFPRPVNVQDLYIAAHNIDLAAWKLFNARDVNMKPYLNLQMDAEAKQAVDSMPMLQELARQVRVYAHKFSGEKPQPAEVDLSRAVFIR
jgi:hypothetical protein